MKSALLLVLSIGCVPAPEFRGVGDGGGDPITVRVLTRDAFAVPVTSARVLLLSDAGEIIDDDLTDESGEVVLQPFEDPVTVVAISDRMNERAIVSVFGVAPGDPVTIGDLHTAYAPLSPAPEVTFMAETGITHVDVTSRCGAGAADFPPPNSPVTSITPIHDERCGSSSYQLMVVQREFGEIKTHASKLATAGANLVDFAPSLFEVALPIQVTLSSPGPLASLDGFISPVSGGARLIGASSNFTAAISDTNLVASIPYAPGEDQILELSTTMTRSGFAPMQVRRRRDPQLVNFDIADDRLAPWIADPVLTGNQIAWTTSETGEAQVAAIQATATRGPVDYTWRWIGPAPSDGRLAIPALPGELASEGVSDADAPELSVTVIRAESETGGFPYADLKARSDADSLFPTRYFDLSAIRDVTFTTAPPP